MSLSDYNNFSNRFELPFNWTFVPLGEIANVKGGKRLPKGHVYSDRPTEHPYIRVTDFEKMTINITNLKFIDKKTHQQISNYIINKSDLYISIAGTIGKVGLIPDFLDGANLTENAAKISNIKVNKKFLCLSLNSGFCQEQIKKFTIHTNQPKLALFRIEKLIIPLPPLKEQKRIVLKLEELFSRLDAGSEYLKKTQVLLKQYRQSVLKYAFEGKLVPQDQNDEPASLLLEKIKQERTNSAKSKPKLNSHQTKLI